MAMETIMLQFEKHAAADENVRKKITYPEEGYYKLVSMCECHEYALDYRTWQWRF